MSKVSELFDDPIMANENTIIIDDEGDQATLNSKVYNKDGELAKTYQVAKEIKDKIKRHCFISITATPQANILIQTSDILSPDFGTLIYPGEGYCGLSVFHGDEEDTFVKEIPENEDSLLDQEGDIPGTFVHALSSFYVSNAIRKARGDNKVHSMLIHPSQKKIDHKKVQDKVNKFLENWRLIASLGTHDLAYINDLKPILVKSFQDYKKEGVLLNNFQDYEIEILNCITKSSDVLVFNSDSINARSDAGNFNTRIYLGGNILDRGITIKGLAITYIIRRAKGYSTVDNTEQRARWFGYKNVPFFSDYIDICRVWATTSIKKDFASINESDEDMWSSIERNINNGKSFKDLPRYFILQHDASHKLRLTRPNVARTEEVSWTEWKKQKYYISGNNAIRNLEILENLRLKTNGYIKNYKGINKHYFVEDYPMRDFIDSVIAQYYFDEKDTFDKTLLRKILDIVEREKLDDKIDLIWLRIDNREFRKINPDGTIQQLFRGRDLKKNTEGRFDYDGDSSTSDDRPRKIQIQIHYVRAKNLTPNNYYSPAICIYIPEDYAFRLVGRTNEE
ncbi:Z1 domain-containing protein [Paracholeplasma manati]|uniref:Z1 domain-containing protein n=1 Tax=Paracholeplasma manati TaxID=591373 RepID=UPI0024085307|nr:Z1 domain-containing protein [Paracholeplasma manati]MDG0889083.1 Z1 domain-containing protein [Paracholeplasma manati]